MTKGRKKAAIVWNIVTILVALSMIGFLIIPYVG